MREHFILIVVRTLGRFISVRILPFARITRLLVRECRQVLAPEQSIDRQLLPLSEGHRIRQEKKDRAKRRCRVETITGMMKNLIVDRK